MLRRSGIAGGRVNRGTIWTRNVVGPASDRSGGRGFGRYRWLYLAL